MERLSKWLRLTRVVAWPRWNANPGSLESRIHACNTLLRISSVQRHRSLNFCLKTSGHLIQNHFWHFLANYILQFIDYFKMWKINVSQLLDLWNVIKAVLPILSVIVKLKLNNKWEILLKKMKAIEIQDDVECWISACIHILWMYIIKLLLCKF